VTPGEAQQPSGDGSPIGGDAAGSTVRVAWDDVPSEVVLPGVERQTVQGERQTLVRYRYAPGSVFPVHAHPEEQVTAVLSGRIVFDVAGERHEVGPGEVVVIPGGVPHGAAVAGDEPVETLNALSPRRAAGPTAARLGSMLGGSP
jgi:quercetin dioxygenase-like cupin family protein